MNCPKNRDGQSEAEAHTESGEEEAKGGEEMKQKITDADALKAAETLRKYCLYYAREKNCVGCIYYWKDAASHPFRDLACRIDKAPYNYNLRTPKKIVEMEAAKK